MGGDREIESSKTEFDRTRAVASQQGIVLDHSTIYDESGDTIRPDSKKNSPCYLFLHTRARGGLPGDAKVIPYGQGRWVLGSGHHEPALRSLPRSRLAGGVRHGCRGYRRISARVTSGTRSSIARTFIVSQRRPTRQQLARLVGVTRGIRPNPSCQRRRCDGNEPSARRRCVRIVACPNCRCNGEYWWRRIGPDARRAADRAVGRRHRQQHTAETTRRHDRRRAVSEALQPSQ